MNGFKTSDGETPQSIWNMPPVTFKGPLVTEMRESLKTYAKNHQYTLQQDTIGNIYITQSGTDTTLSGIALQFPLDARHGTQTHENPQFLSALHVFESLKNAKTACDIVLVGWSSPGGRGIGKAVWEGETTLEGAYSSLPELKQFGNDGSEAFPNPEEVYLSAIIEVLEDGKVEGSGILEVEGSFVLVDKAKKISGGEAKEKKQHGESPTSNKAPIVRIEGKGAEEIARKLVVDYSRYVAGLFENFD